MLKTNKWINTKVVFEWNGFEYIERIVEGYWYKGELALADEPINAGHGGGGGGGAGGNGGAVVLIMSNLAQSLLDSGKIVVEVDGGTGGTNDANNVSYGGLAGGDVNNGASSNHGVKGTDGLSGTNLTQIV